MSRRARRAPGGTARRPERVPPAVISGPPAGTAFVRRCSRIVRRRGVTIALVLAAIHVLMALLTFEPQPHTGGDNAAYITLARSLLETGTYTELWDPATPPHTKYPPGFPLVLAAALALGLTPWVQLKLVVLAFSATAVAFSFLWMRGRGRPMLAVGTGLLLAIAPGVLREGRWVLSDVPFWAFTAVALWAFDRLRPGDWKRFGAAAFVLLLAYFTRSAGLPLVVAALGLLALRKMWAQFAALAMIIGVPATAWWLRSRAYAPSGYVSEFWLVNPYQPSLGRIGVPQLVQRVSENIGNYASMHIPLLLTNNMGLLLTLVSSLILVLGVAGWARRVRRPGVAELFTPLYLGLICIWPAVWSGERFVLPALALILFYAADAITWLFNRVHRSAGLAAAGVGGLMLVLLAIPGVSLGMQVGRMCTGLYLDGQRYPCLGHPAWDEFFALAEQAPALLPDDAVVLNRKPRLFYQLSGLRGRMFPMVEDPDALFATADSIGARYVVFDQTDGISTRYLAPSIQRYPDAFCLVRLTPVTTSALLGIRGRNATQAVPGSLTYCDADFFRAGAGPDAAGVRE